MTALSTATGEPDITDELRAAHLDLSAEDWAYREVATADPRYLRRESFEILDRPNLLLRFRLQSWPAFIRRSWIAELARISVGINELLRSIPERVFGGDAVAISEFYGLYDPALTEIMFAEPNGVATALSRGDFIVTEDGLRCIEFNFTPSLGGWETGLLAGLHRSIPVTAEFLAGHGVEVGWTNTLTRLFGHLFDTVAACPRCADEQLNVGLVLIEWETSPRSALAFLQDEYQAALRKRGLRGKIVVCDYSSLDGGGGVVRFEGTRLHALIDVAQGMVTAPVYRAFKSGTVCLFNGPIDPVITDKRNIALLSENADTEVFPEAGRELIRRHVPWTRRAVPGPVLWEGAEASLDELLRADRGRFVLKHVAESGGKGVVLGSGESAEGWESVVANAMIDGQWIAQERLTSVPYLFQCGESGFAPHDVIWGPFVFGSEYAGVILRMLPRAAGRPINLSGDATEGVVFEV